MNEIGDLLFQNQPERSESGDEPHHSLWRAVRLGSKIEQTQQSHVTVKACPQFMRVCIMTVRNLKSSARKEKPPALCSSAKERGRKSFVNIYTSLYAGKLLEKFLEPRLCAAFEEAERLSEKQYVFRIGHSTINTVKAQGENHYSYPITLLGNLVV